jgi:hypothetical protein
MIQKQLLRSPRLGILLTIALLIVVLLYVPSKAEEIRYPVPSYVGEQLKKVREWEKQWAGKKISTATIDKVKEFIPESLYSLISDPKTWGESWFEIVPYREIKPSKGELKLTREYAGTCSIGPSEELLNYISGIPFPNPKTGIEVAYNFDNVNHGDNAHAVEDMYIVDGKRRYDRKMGVEAHFLYFSGRREIPPVPELSNPKGIFRATHVSFFAPASMKGNRSLMIKWKDRTKPYESYSFSSSTRKIVRHSNALRDDTQGGGDSTDDDQNMYDNAIPYMKYKFLGRKELLLGRHQDVDQLAKEHREGYCLFDGIQRERLNTIVLECTHKNPNYIYSKQIWYVDPETWWILYADKYDRKGELWRVFENVGYVIPSVYNKELIGTMGFILIIDKKLLHATGGFSNYTFGETGELYDPAYYNSRALQKYGY